MDFVNSAWDSLFKSQTQSKQSLRVCLNRTYFAETENWKYYSKIIFKCVNNTVWPIFNEKVTEKWNLWVHKQCTNVLFTKDLVKCCGWIFLKKKGKTWKVKCTATFGALQTGTLCSIHLFINFSLFLFDFGLWVTIGIIKPSKPTQKKPKINPTINNYLEILRFFFSTV